MWFFLLLFLSASVDASCGTNRLAYYDSLIRQGRTQDAFNQVLHDLHATPGEKAKVSLEALSGVSSDAEYAVTLADLKDSKSLACQRTANHLSKIREKPRIHNTIRQYHQEWEAAPSHWNGCNIQDQNVTDSDAAARVAIQCLEDVDFATHASAREIRALLAQSQAAEVPRLRDEDADALQAQLRIFFENRTLLRDSLNDNYYLPSLKRNDQASFCQGVRYVRDILGQRTDETHQWQKACLPVSQ